MKFKLPHCKPFSYLINWKRKLPISNSIPDRKPHLRKLKIYSKLPPTRFPESLRFPVPGVENTRTSFQATDLGRRSGMENLETVSTHVQQPRIRQCNFHLNWAVPKVLPRLYALVHSSRTGSGSKKTNHDGSGWCLSSTTCWNDFNEDRSKYPVLFWPKADKRRHRRIWVISLTSPFPRLPWPSGPKEWGQSAVQESFLRAVGQVWQLPLVWWFCALPNGWKSLGPKGETCLGAFSEHPHSSQ